LSLFELFRKLNVFVRPYRFLVIATLLLTAVGSFMAQVNAHILRYTVDEITALTIAGKTLQNGFSLLLTISSILLAKELIYAVIRYGQKFYGEKLRIYISRDISQDIVEKILTYRMVFYTSPVNEKW
jgi:ABC-type multidrug transport system fused ATPase/permease subunit